MSNARRGPREECSPKHGIWLTPEEAPAGAERGVHSPRFSHHDDAFDALLTDKAACYRACMKALAQRLAGRDQHRGP